MFGLLIHSSFVLLQMALMKHRGLFELLETHGRMLLDTKFQADNSVYGNHCLQAASQATRIAIVTMLEELAPNLWEDDLDRLVDFGHLISPALEMVMMPHGKPGSTLYEAYCMYLILCKSVKLAGIRWPFYSQGKYPHAHTISFECRTFSHLCCTGRQ